MAGLCATNGNILRIFTQFAEHDALVVHPGRAFKILSENIITSAS